jgi:Protein of unknown function (DUF1566)
MTMNTSHRFYAVLLGIGFAALTACSSSNTPTEVAVDFSIDGVKGTINGQNVTIDLTTKEACSNLTSLVADVQANGASISPNPTVARDYSSPVAFTITASDGTKVVYNVTVKGNICTSAPPAPPVTPKECKADAIGSTGYSLVFKGCDANNVAEYYDKTECVRDNATGLIWQGQTPAGTGLRANDQYKTNFDSTSLLQVSLYEYSPTVGGYFREPTQDEINASNNSIGFKNAVNATSLCGSSAWRMPTLVELSGLVRQEEAPKINNVWFPNTPQEGFYWSSTSSVLDHFADAVYFYVGFSYYADRTYLGGKYLVRLVR